MTILKMKGNILLLGISALSALACAKVKTKPIGEIVGAASFYDLSFQTIDGKMIDFSSFKGKKVLIVNTASACGFTHQYAELQELHEKYGDKLVILAFPCNQFGGQEPGTNSDINSFCQKNYGVSFQIFEKSDVKGADQNPIFNWLTKKELNGWNEEEPSWNFCKYLVNENGELIRFFSSRVKPMSDEILNLL